MYMLMYYTYICECVCHCRVLDCIGCILYSLVLRQRSMHIGIYKGYVIFIARSISHIV